MFRQCKNLGGQFLGLCLFQLVDAGCGFRAHDVASPVTTDLENKIEKLGKCTFILTRREQKLVNTVLTQ
uniref:Uncharacterized protein n=1 Tax=Sparus aurata TaxID=8175 RepID=A0A671W2F0_SPAAU